MMRKILKVFSFLSILFMMWSLPTTVYALIGLHYGNEPVTNRGWPTGTVEVTNLPSRLGYMEGPPFGEGEYYFQYSCKDTAEFNEALRKFGAIRAPRIARRSLISLDGQITWIMDDKPLLLVVHDWNKDALPKFLGEEAAKDGQTVVWTFTVWVPENFHSLFSNSKRSLFPDHPNFRQPVPQPRIDVYVGGESTINWEAVEVPHNVRVIDKRAEAAPVSVDAGGVIKGSLFDMATHQVIADANVILVKRIKPRQWEEAVRTETDKDGFFEIQAIPEGYYEIHVCANGYADRNVGIFHNRNGHTYFELDALLIKTASSKGMVQDTEGNPVPGVKVYAREIIGIDGYGYKCLVDPSATTNEEGHFELKSVPGGFIHIRCPAPSLHQVTSTLDIYEVSLKPWREPDVIKIVVSGTGKVSGKVVGRDGRAPERVFMVEIEPKQGLKIGTWGGSMRCKEDGGFEFKGVPPGEYVVVAKPNPMREGEASAPKLVTITVGKTVELEIVSDYAHRRKGR